MNQGNVFFGILQKLFSSKLTKELLTFCFFLIISFVFWFLLVMNDTAEREIKIPVKVQNIPDDVIVTDIIDSVKVTLHDKGFVVYAIPQESDIKPIIVDFKTTQKGTHAGVLSTTELRNSVKKILGTSSNGITIKPSDISYRYQKAASKMVKVKLNGVIRPDSSYYLMRTQIEPESVTVTAGVNDIDNIESVTTERISHEGFVDKITTTANLVNIKNARIYPQQVTVTAYADVLTDESMLVPVRCANIPQGISVRLFPSRIKVSFITGIKTFKNISTEDFDLVVDYADIQKKPTEKPQVYIHTIPSGISRVKLDVNNVDYILEDNQTGETQGKSR